MSEPSVLIVGTTRRGRGRPRVSPDQPSTDVLVAMSEGMYDRAYLVATRERISVPEVIRRALDRLLADTR